MVSSSSKLFGVVGICKVDAICTPYARLRATRIAAGALCKRELSDDGARCHAEARLAIIIVTKKLSSKYVPRVPAPCRGTFVSAWGVYYVE